jgi:hypothetical protein
MCVLSYPKLPSTWKALGQALVYSTSTIYKQSQASGM